MNPSTLTELVIAISFAAGLNVYLTVLTLGGLARFGWVALPGGLHALSSPWVLGAAAVLVLADFVADKVPGLDLAWNVAHTLVRVPAAALLAYGATTHLSPGLQVLAVAVGAAIATLAHGTKIAARAAVSASPEPVSNVALSAAGDSAVIGISWAATHHPLVAALAALALAALGVGVSVALARAVRRGWQQSRERWGPRLAGLLRAG